MDGCGASVLLMAGADSHPRGLAQKRAKTSSRYYHVNAHSLIQGPKSIKLESKSTEPTTCVVGDLISLIFHAESDSLISTKNLELIDAQFTTGTTWEAWIGGWVCEILTRARKIPHAPPPSIRNKLAFHVKIIILAIILVRLPHGGGTTD